MLDTVEVVDEGWQGSTVELTHRHIRTENTLRNDVSHPLGVSLSKIDPKVASTGR